MATFTSMLQTMRQAEKYAEKTQFTTYILRNLESKRIRLTTEDKAELSTMAFAEIAAVAGRIPEIKTYREKDEAIGYADDWVSIVTHCFPSPEDVPAEKLAALEVYIYMRNKERFVENEVDHVFGDGHNSRYEMEHLIEIITPVKDEYQRGMLYNGMLHYKDKLKDIPDDAKDILTAYMAAEIKRYISGEPNEEMINALEVACDVSAYLLNDELTALLYEVLKLGYANVNYYAVGTLLKARKRIPDEAVKSLAADLEYAGMTYVLLEQYGQTNRFPPECATEEYLAKSTMIRWLVYPTELGQLPDEIEYLGKVKKKEVYHIFRFKSNSDNLEGARKGVWLIGWSSEEGGTFSEFDLYADFEQKTVEKTLKYIKRKLL
ncbi:MAG: hypothetical protein IJW00_11255 [Clostridia bacterium]|nr:hypothetical protein [Clostridia bacterium]